MFDLAKFSLKGKVAIITGGGRGIGKAIAGGMAKAGARVIITSRTTKELDEVAAEIRASGGDVFPAPTDIGNLESIEALVKTVMDKYGRIDILVNNAGLAKAEPVLDVDIQSWDSQINVNIRGTFFLSKACAKIMKEQGGGNIINVGSVDGIKAEPSGGVYSITKAAIRMLTKVFANELATDKIRVNTILPGPVDTKLLDINWEGLSADAVEAMKAQFTPMGRIADPDELVGAAIYLASDASSFTTAAEILVDGGLLLKWN